MPSPITVHVVDDEKVIAQTVAMILNRVGFRATAFFSGEESLEAAKSAPPALLVTDVVMPGIDGIHLGIQFRKLYPACKILLFSGQAATSGMLDEANKEGHYFEIVPKPIHPAELLAKLKEL